MYSLFVTILIASVGLFSVPAADDFCNFNKVNTFKYVYQYVIDIYLGWTGRVLSTYAIGAAFKYIPLSDVGYISFVLGLLFCFSGYFFVKFIISKKASVSIGFISSVVMAYFFVFIKKNLLSEIVYWPTGGIVYIFPIALAAYVLSLIDSEEGELRFRNLILSFLLGGALENLTLGVLGYLGTQFLCGLIFKDSFKKNKKYLVHILMTIAGAIVLFVAPGNFKRAGVGKSSFNFDIIFLIKSFFKILKNYSEIVAGSMSIYFLLIIILAGMLFYRVVIKKKSLIFNANTFEQNGLLRKGIALCSGGLVTILPMVFVSEFVASRTGTIFFYFMFFGFMALFIFIFSKLGLVLKKKHIYGISFLVLVVFSQMILSEFSDNRKFLREYNERELLIGQAPAGDVIVDSIKSRPSKHIHFMEITNDKSHWINACTAEYHKKKSIRTK